MNTRRMRLRLGKVSGKPISIVRTVERFSASWTSDSIYDKSEQQADTASGPSNRKQDAKKHLRVKQHADGDASDHCERARRQEDGYGSVDLPDPS